MVIQVYKGYIQGIHYDGYTPRAAPWILSQVRRGVEDVVEPGEKESEGLATPRPRHAHYVPP